MFIVETYLLKFLSELREHPEFLSIDIIRPDSKNESGDTPLHVAAVRGDLVAANLLIEAGVDLNARGEHGYTPLHEACLQGNNEMVRLLVNSGADKWLENADGCNALDLSEQVENSETAHILRDNGLYG